MSVGSVLAWILAGILALLLALLVLPVGIRVCYDASGFRVCLLAGPIRWQLLPAKFEWLFQRRTKAKPVPAAKPAGKPAGKREPAHKGGAWSSLKPYLPVLRNFLQGLRRRLLVRQLEFWVKLGGDDPCDLAIRYGRVWACLGAMQPLLDHALRIRRKDSRCIATLRWRPQRRICVWIWCCVRPVCWDSCSGKVRRFSEFMRNKKIKKAV